MVDHGRVVGKASRAVITSDGRIAGLSADVIAELVAELVRLWHERHQPTLARPDHVSGRWAPVRNPGWSSSTGSWPPSCTCPRGPHTTLLAGSFGVDRSTITRAWIASDEDHRTDGVQRPILPFGHVAQWQVTLEDPVPLAGGSSADSHRGSRVYHHAADTGDRELDASAPGVCTLVRPRRCPRSGTERRSEAFRTSPRTRAPVPNGA